MRVLLGLLLLLVLVVPVSASSITLLAASEDGEFGSTALATLETTPGSGRVFVETSVLSGQDTQSSIRLAKDIICTDYISGCDEYDFFYTIETNAPIITGPSAGAAVAVLTFAHLQNISLPRDFAITGTINSGGFIGTVGGLKAKIRAADTNNIKRVYIAVGNRFYRDFNISELNMSNATFDEIAELIPSEDLVDFGKSLGVSVSDVGSIDDILANEFGVSFNYTETQIPVYYSELMKIVADDLCLEAETLQKQFSNISSANELLNTSIFAREQGSYYSAASFCFGVNIILREEAFANQSFNVSANQVQEVISIAQSNQRLEFETLNDLQIYAVVQERIADAKDSLADAINTSSINRLAYAYERAKTAISWQTFYTVPGDTIVGSRDSLRLACLETIEQAELRIQYVQFYVPFDIDAQETLADAKENQRFGDYALCLYNSLQAKAQADTISSAIGTTEDELDRLLEVKERIATKYVSSQQSETHFPIIGYSYLEYANSLKESDPYAALLYFQFAQELSALDLFLDSPESSETTQMYFSKKLYSSEEYFVFGLILGLLLAVIVFVTNTILSRCVFKKYKPLRASVNRRPRGKKR